MVALSSTAKAAMPRFCRSAAAIWNLNAKARVEAQGAFRARKINGRSECPKAGPPQWGLARQDRSNQQTRPALHRYHPHPGDGRGAESEVGPPGHADGVGARRLHALAERAEVRLRRSKMAEPRPLRAFQWPCLDAALRAAASCPGQGSERGRPAGGQPR